MDCRILLERLDDLIGGRMSPDERRAAEQHLEQCDECRDLSAISGKLEGMTIEPPPGLLESVLKRTTGETCGSARGRLCDHIDGLLPQVDDELVRLHLNGCNECTRLAGALARMSEDLPALAELQPDDRFVGDVLARTVARRKRATRWVAQIAQGWRQLVQRPRFAWEGAYIGLIFLTLIFGIPSSPLAGVPQRALDMVRTNPMDQLAGPIGQYAPRIRITVRSSWQTSRNQVAGATRGFAEDVSRRSSSTLNTISTELGTIWDRLTSEETTNDTNEQADDAGLNQGEKP